MSEQTDVKTEHRSVHLLLMLACCLLPIVAVFALVVLFPGNPYLSLLAVAICPLSMVLMHLPDLLRKKREKTI